MMQLQSQKPGGMTHATGVLQWMAINSSEGVDRQGEVVGSPGESFDCLELNDGENRVEYLCLRIRGKAKKADIMVGVCYKPPN